MHELGWSPPANPGDGRQGGGGAHGGGLLGGGAGIIFFFNCEQNSFLSVKVKKGTYWKEGLIPYIARVLPSDRLGSIIRLWGRRPGG